MKLTQLKAFENFLKENPAYFSFYLFSIKDESVCEEAVQLLIQRLWPDPQVRMLGLMTLDGSQLQENDLWNALDSHSLFTNQRMIWIQQADKLKKTLLDKLEKALSHPSVFFILSASSWLKTSSFYQLIEQKGIVVELSEIKPWEKEAYLSERIIQWFAQEQKKCSAQVSYALMKQIGTDQNILISEIHKLVCYCGDRPEVNLEDVKAICSTYFHQTIWQLGEAIFFRDAKQARQIAHAFLKEGNALLPLIRQLRSQFQTGYQVSLLLGMGKHSQEIMHEFPYMKGQILDRQIKQAQTYGIQAFQQGLIKLDTSEMQLKNSEADEMILVETLIIHLTKPI